MKHGVDLRTLPRRNKHGSSPESVAVVCDPDGVRTGAQLRQFQRCFANAALVDEHGSARGFRLDAEDPHELLRRIPLWGRLR